MAVHPILIHFPLALLVVGHLALIFSLFRPLQVNIISTTRLALEGFINGALGLGFAGLILSVITGLFDMQASPKTLAVEGWLPAAIIHIILALLLLPLNGIVLYRRFVLAAPLPETGSIRAGEAGEQPAVKVRVDYSGVALSALALALLTAAGFMGGRLVFEYHVGIG